MLSLQDALFFTKVIGFVHLASSSSSRSSAHLDAAPLAPSFGHFGSSLSPQSPGRGHAVPVLAVARLDPLPLAAGHVIGDLRPLALDLLHLGLSTSSRGRM